MTAPVTRRTVAGVAAAAYVGVVVLANYVTSRYGQVPVGFGLMAAAGTYCAGLALGLRDVVHNGFGRTGVLVVIALGSLLSYALASPVIATASLAAFAVAELCDLAVYEPLRARGLVPAVIASNVVGGVVDTCVFLWLAPFPLTGRALLAQMIAKVLWATLLPVALIVLARRAVVR